MTVMMGLAYVLMLARSAWPVMIGPPPSSQVVAFTLSMPNFSPLAPPGPSGTRDTCFWQAPQGTAGALALARLADEAPLLVVTPDTASSQRLESALRFFARVPVCLLYTSPSPRD